MKPFPLFLAFLTGCLVFSSCQAGEIQHPQTPTTHSPLSSSTHQASSSPVPSSTQIPTVNPTGTPTAQPRLTLSPSGPDLDQFSPKVNPLTSLQQEDPSLLNFPAVLVSISNMPVTARPQAGTSFAPWIYEMFIGEGTTRFMGVFYGDLPRRIPNDPGDCPLNTVIFQPKGSWVGNRVWLDENKNGIQEPWEAGIGGICISLEDEQSAKIIGSTSTDSNGYYAFDTSLLQPGGKYDLVMELPSAYQFTLPHVGNDDQDSDADPTSGRISFTNSNQIETNLDVGLVLTKPGPVIVASSDIAPERTYVGPIRSGRLTYNDFVEMYPAGCLVYASAGNGIRQRLEGCEIIFGEQPLQSPNTALLDVGHLKELAQKNKVANQPVNYSGNLFDPNPPDGGLPATSLWTYFHAFSQSFWQFNPVSGSYLRLTDDGDGKGIFHPDTDRLTGRQLEFENIAIILADYQVFRHGQYDINLCCGLEGYAYLFRDGQMYKIRWSTNNGSWEKTSGLRRPLHFTTVDKQPFPLKPGRTWVSIMTLNSFVRESNPGQWQANFSMPNDYAPPD